VSTTLLTLGSQTFSPTGGDGQGNYGPYPFSFTGFTQALFQCVPTAWPASGDVVIVTLMFDSGKGGIVTFPGGTWPRKGIPGPAMAVGVPPGEPNLTVSIQVLQQFTAGGSVIAQ